MQRMIPKIYTMNSPAETERTYLDECKLNKESATTQKDEVRDRLDNEFKIWDVETRAKLVTEYPNMNE